MRITEHRMIQIATQNITDMRERAQEASDKVSSGLEVSRPSQNAAAWAEGKRTEARLLMTESHATNISRARERLAEVEGVFGSLSEIVARAKELAVQGANGTYDANERALIAVEIRSLREAALAAANAKSADGEFLLAGSLGDAAPFDAAGLYQGDSSTREVEVAASTRHSGTMTGARLTAAHGVDLFATFDAFATALDSNDVPGVQAAIGNLDVAIDQVARARAEGGVMMNAFDRADEARMDFELVMADVYSRSVEADVVDAASELAQTSNALQTAQTVSLRIIELARSGQ